MFVFGNSELICEPKSRYFERILKVLRRAWCHGGVAQQEFGSALLLRSCRGHLCISIAKAESSWLIMVVRCSVAALSFRCLKLCCCLLVPSFEALLLPSRSVV
jgi:hypothetical protein